MCTYTSTYEMCRHTSRYEIYYWQNRSLFFRVVIFSHDKGGLQDKKKSLYVREREREMFYLTTHSTHFIYGYMASDIWLRTILIVRKETRCRHIGYSYRLTARVLLYAPSHRQDNTYHGLCYTSRGALAGTRLYIREFYREYKYWSITNKTIVTCSNYTPL